MSGCHWLQMCMGRRCCVFYEQRRCPSCPDCIEDEMHAIAGHIPYKGLSIQTYLRVAMMFNQSINQFLKSVRDLAQIHQTIYKFPPISRDVDSLKSLWASNPPHRVANFLTDCRNVAMFGQPDGNMISTSHDYV